jgi:16S rRNA (guanine527-N7)-methyltransferase
MSSFSADAQKLTGIQLSDAQLAAFDLYERELIEWNQRFNLTSITEPAQVRTKHFLDSLSCWLAMSDQAPARVIDVGTGAGFPGLPLKILQPRIQLTLVEATAKKAGFLNHMVQVLRLEKAAVVAKRAEEAGLLPEHREVYDCAVARALAPMPVLAEYLLPFVKVGGLAVAQKGKGAAEETKQAEKAIGALGGKLKAMMPVSIPGLEEERWLVVIEKIAATPANYPRRPGMPTKRPLG